MKKGRMKMAPAKVIRDSAFGPDNLYMIRKTSAFFRKLSLKAERNCVQNKGAKRFWARSANMRFSRESRD